MFALCLTWISRKVRRPMEICPRNESLRSEPTVPSGHYVPRRQHRQHRHTKSIRPDQYEESFLQFNKMIFLALGQRRAHFNGDNPSGCSRNTRIDRCLSVRMLFLKIFEGCACMTQATDKDLIDVAELTLRYFMQSFQMLYRQYTTP